MYALSLYQPYASLVAIGAKRWETRPFRISKRHGAVAFCSTSKMPLDCELLLKHAAFRGPLERAGIDPEKLPLGQVLAIGTCEEAIGTKEWIRRHCRHGKMRFHHEQEYMFGDYGPRRFASFFPKVSRLVEPVPCRGMQGLWQVPADLEAKILEQLPIEEAHNG